MKTLICYDDNPDFGGHQVMACLAVEALAQQEDLRTVFFSSPANRRLNERLKEIQQATRRLELKNTPFSTRKLQGVWNRFAGAQKTALKQIFSLENPEIILCIQGEVEDASLALCAAQKLDAPCISYIPVPHRMALMGAKLGAARDALNAYLFRKPDGWITISQSMKERLEERGTIAPIEVVHNGIDSNCFRPIDRAEAREKLNLPLDCFLVGSIGRVAFNQKQQAFLARSFSKAWKNDPSVHLVIAGDGPDRETLEQIIRELRMEQQITLLPWQSDSSMLYAAIDLLAIPSRFEGVPLVMLEALACGTPVAASARDGMKDLLPAEWTFPTENEEKMIETIARFISGREWVDPLRHLQNQVRNEYTIEAFQKNFVNAVRRFIR
jgi:glycosyltransferase involved in cell wall biosynthesis